MSKYAKMDGLVEFVYELREAGTPWDKEGGIVTQVKAKYEGYTTNSAIPLRNLYNAHKARVDAEHKMPATKRAVTAARDSGWGWAAIAGRTGKSIKQVKDLYNGEHPEGRIYVDQAGNISTVKTDFTRAEDADADDTDEDATEDDASDVIADGEDEATTSSEEVAA